LGMDASHFGNCELRGSSAKQGISKSRRRLDVWSQLP